jgi:hypothetical protein
MSSLCGPDFFATERHNVEVAAIGRERNGNATNIETNREMPNPEMKRAFEVLVETPFISIMVIAHKNFIRDVNMPGLIHQRSSDQAELNASWLRTVIILATPQPCVQTNGTNCGVNLCYLFLHRYSLPERGYS